VSVWYGCSNWVTAFGGKLSSEGKHARELGSGDEMREVFENGRESQRRPVCVFQNE